LAVDLLDPSRAMPAIPPLHVAAGGLTVYLHLEEVVSERASFERDVLVRWAFRGGRRRERR